MKMEGLWKYTKIRRQRTDKEKRKNGNHSWGTLIFYGQKEGRDGKMKKWVIFPKGRTFKQE